jgi:hypothetical protein
MTIQAFLIQLLTILVLGLLSITLPWGVVQISKHVKNARLRLALQTLAALAYHLVCAAAGQVRAAKITGNWTQALGSTVKGAVVADLKVLGKQAVADIATVHSPDDVEKVLSTLVESGVEQAKAEQAVVISAVAGGAK